MIMFNMAPTGVYGCWCFLLLNTCSSMLCHTKCMPLQSSTAQLRPQHKKNNTIRWESRLSTDKGVIRA